MMLITAITPKNINIIILNDLKGINMMILKDINVMVLMEIFKAINEKTTITIF